MKKILLIGGTTYDYIATSDVKLVHHVANNGTVATGCGGVIQNIAVNLSRLGNRVTVMTVLNHDQLGKLLLKNYQDNKIKVILAPSKYPTGTYIAINDNNHDLAVSICDNRCFKDITIDFIKKHAKEINTYDYLVLDSNLTKNTIEYITKTYKHKKIFVDAISPALVMKYQKAFKDVYLMKFNLFEARALAKAPKLNQKELVSALFKMGLKNMIISNASHDIYYGLNKKTIGTVKVKIVKKFKNTTGCGDALLSGVIDYLSQDKSFKEAIEFGYQLALLTLMSDQPTAPSIKRYAHR